MDPTATRSALLARVRTRLIDDRAEPTPAALAAAVRAEEGLLPPGDVAGLSTALVAEIHGLGPLDPLVRDERVTDVLVDGPDRVWIDRGDGLESVDLRFAGEWEVRDLARRLAARCGRRLDDAAPWVDAHLPDGTRVHAVLPPVAASGTSISVRVARRRAFTLDDLVACGALPPVGADWLRAIVRARLAFVLSGGTGTGKTTVLSTLLGLIDPRERLVLIEDSAELRPEHGHVVRLGARPPNVEGEGEVTLRDLVRQALRMRPDRIVVGEVRGAEVVDLLTALNTGHDGGCATVHANTVAAVPARLEALGALAGLDRDALHSQLAAALDVVVHLVRERDGRRRVAAIGLLVRDAQGLVVPVDALGFGRDGEVRCGPGEPALRRRIESADDPGAWSST